MPTYITTEENAKNQKPTQNAHFAQNFAVLNLKKGSEIKKSGMEKLIPVQEIQVDPCGNGWEKSTLRQTVPHLHYLEFLSQMTMILN